MIAKWLLQDQDEDNSDDDQAVEMTGVACSGDGGGAGGVKHNKV